MPDLFGLDIASIVNSAIGDAGGLRPATLVKMTPGTRTGGSLSYGTNPTQASYTTSGIFEPSTAADAQTLTRRQRGTVMLLAKPLGSVVPETGDQVTIEGAAYAVEAVSRDPAAATYSCTVSGA